MSVEKDTSALFHYLEDLPYKIIQRPDIQIQISIQMVATIAGKHLIATIAGVVRLFSSDDHGIVEVGLHSTPTIYIIPSKLLQLQTTIKLRVRSVGKTVLNSKKVCFERF